MLGRVSVECFEYLSIDADDVIEIAVGMSRVRRHRTA